MNESTSSDNSQNATMKDSSQKGVDSFHDTRYGGIGMAETRYTIESGIPMAETVSGQSKYPFRSMGVGDSFSVPLGPEIRRVRVAAAKFSERNPEFKFKARGTRIWRVEAT